MRTVLASTKSSFVSPRTRSSLISGGLLTLMRARSDSYMASCAPDHVRHFDIGISSDSRMLKDVGCNSSGNGFDQST